MMKRVLLLAVCFVAFFSACLAQDVIVTKDSKKINAKVLEVNVDNIRYKNFDNEDGPIYTMLKSDVVTILYQNGQVDTFEQAKVTTLAPVKLAPEMKTKDPILYKEYRKYERMKNAGNSLIALGIGTTVLGAVYFAASADKTPAIGYGALAVGEVFLAAGIPLSTVGKGKRNGVIEDFRKQYDETSSTSSHLRLNLHANGVGVSYVFGGK